LINELEVTKTELTEALQTAAISRNALEQALASLEQKHRELHKLSNEFRAASITDPLTAVYNRRFFFEATAKLVSAASRHHHPLSILMIDIDHFKKINDTYGHLAGDAVLQALAAHWREALREEDICARFGGEEFIIALPNTDATLAAAVAERLLSRSSRQPLDADGHPCRVTISCGVSQFRFNEHSIEETLKRADEALYAAKNAGRKRVVVS
jgi:two-component system, NtrC family, C4-dicarboxylate transport sensor histidine kinase DctB